MFRVLLICFWLVGLAGQAVAAVAPAADWDERIDGGTIIVMSPENAEGQRIIMLAGTADPVPADFATWFEAQIAAIEAITGPVQSRRNLPEIPLAAGSGAGDLSQTEVTLETADRVSFSAYIASYPAGGHVQAIAVLYPAELASDDQHLQLAKLRVQALWQSGYLNLAGGDPAPAEDAVAGAIGHDAVKAVVIGSVVRLGGVLITERVPFLLLKDGRSFQEEGASPLDFNPAVRGPDRFEPGQWHATPDGYRVDYPDASFYDLDASGKLESAAADFVLTGTYVARGGRYGANYAEKLVFNPDGTVSSDQIANLNDPNFNSTDSVQSGGPFSVNRWSITIPAVNGQPLRALFAKSPGTEPPIICIGYTLYLRQSSP